MPESFLQEKLFRDPVYDQIVLDANNREDRVLMALIDTPEFQRLRRIRQLGMALVAYQGAEHSRFAHSIGAMWIVTRILDRFQRAYGIDPAHVFPARCAALLHDLGHGPFSHVLEPLFGKDHELWTQEIICSSDCEINHVLCGYDLALPSAVIAVLRHQYDPPFIGELISSQLDADRFDYLIRDSLMTGVKHGVFDLERLIYCLRLDGPGRRLMVSSSGVHAVEKYLESRYHMFRQVYQHKTVKSAEAMLAALLRRAMDLSEQGAGLPRMRTREATVRSLAYPYKSAFAHFLMKRGRIALKDFLALDDATFQHHWNLWRDHADPILSDLARRLLKRDIFKTLEVNPGDERFESRLEDARALLNRHGMDPNYYLLRLDAGDIPYRPFEEGGGLHHAPILIGDDSDSERDAPRDLRDVSHIAAALAREAYTQTHLAFPESKGATDLRKEMAKIFNVK